MPRKTKFFHGANKEEDEASVNSELRARNMFEDGTSVEYRRNLLQVLRNSQTTADEERRSRTKRKKPQVSEEQANELELPALQIEEDKSSSQASSKAGSVSSTDSIEMVDTSDQSVPNVSVEGTTSITNEEGKSQDSPENKESSPATLKHDHLRDKKRNINPFFVDKESYRDSFKRKRGKDYLRFPFDLLAQGLDYDTFAVEFRKYSISYAKKLEKARNKKLNCVEWGKPIVGPTFTLPPRTRKDSVCNTETRANQRYNLRGRQNKIERDYLEFLDDDNSSESLSSPGGKGNNDMSQTDDIILNNEVKDNSKKDQQSRRDSPPLVIVEEINSAKKLYLQENLNQSMTHSSDKSPKKVNVSTPSQASEASSPTIPTKRLSLRRANASINSNDKNETCEGSSPVVIVEDTDKKELLQCENLKSPVSQRTISSPASTPNKEHYSLPSSPTSSPVVSLKRLPSRTDPSRVVVCDNDRKTRAVDRTESPPVPDQNVTKRRRLDFQLADDNVVEVEEDRLSNASRSPAPCLPAIKNVEDSESPKISCPICNQLFSSDIIQEHASECVQYVDEDEEMDRSLTARAKRTRNN
ncbi:uncharacterized protein LOC124612464 isoform X1 [Schistocerca americana]|uniref:uncharacterized protein LOC124612464 isoform X1 n=2 Tax=Schistocerca americana TaxID=7009 RepID=UPI001F50410B|nr:uncharacterized protein LOC124612464 isoform X1 [Schistocerca americana]